jgi:hypothetical protein
MRAGFRADFSISHQAFQGESSMRYQSFAAALLLAGLLAASPAWGQAPPSVDPPLGPQFVVNETASAGTQSYPSVAFGPEGRYMAVWTSPGGGRVFSRLLDLKGAPLGGQFEISPGGSAASLPRVAGGGGGFAVVWLDQGVVFRRFDGHGQPQGQAIRLDGSGLAGVCDVAVNAAGDALVIWAANGIQGQVFARRVSAGGTLGDIRKLTASGTGATRARVAAAPDGGFLTLWDPTPPFPAAVLMAERVDAAGNWALPFQVNENPTSGFFVVPDVRPLFRPDGGFSILWRRGPFQIQLPIPYLVRARSWDAAGNPLTHEITVDFPVSFSFDAAREPGGNTLVFTADSQFGARGRLFDNAWNPLTRNLVFHQPVGALQSEPAAAVDAAGDFLALWALEPEEIPPPPGSSSGVLGRSLAATTCASSSETLCLGPDGRFRAHVAWRNPFNGDTGTGRTLPLTADSGTFWFFGDQNLELMVKVLDGTVVNGHFWVYAGALSNVEYTLTVIDSLTGNERSYHNPAFQFASRADVNAFPAAVGGVGSETTAETTAGTATAAGAIGVKTDAIGECLPVPAGSTSLCLGSGHFTVSVEFTDPRTGLTGAATAVPLTSDTGAFWFFDDSNLELMIKILDGRTLNGKFWVFFGALSDVDYTITVTRLETGEVKTYHNPRGTLASRADTAAF